MWDTWWFVVAFVAACGLQLTFLSPAGGGRWYAITWFAVGLTFVGAAISHSTELAVVAAAGFVLLVVSGRTATRWPPRADSTHSPGQVQWLRGRAGGARRHRRT